MWKKKSKKWEPKEIYLTTRWTRITRRGNYFKTNLSEKCFQKIIINVWCSYSFFVINSNSLLTQLRQLLFLLLFDSITGTVPYPRQCVTHDDATFLVTTDHIFNFVTDVTIKNSILTKFIVLKKCRNKSCRELKVTRWSDKDTLISLIVFEIFEVLFHLWMFKVRAIWSVTDVTYNFVIVARTTYL